MTTISIGNINAEPGSVARGKLGSVYLSDGTPIDIPLIVMNGSQAGPVLWVSAAMHGQELSGIGVIWELVQRLNPKSLRGTVVFAPMLDPLSFTGGTYYTPQDGYNFNRVFPGDPKGLLTARMASLTLEAIQHVDYLIDFHANPEPAMCFSIIKESTDAKTWDKSREMAEAFGITTIEMVLKFEAHRTGTMTDAAIGLGKPSLVIELIPWRRISPHAVQIGVRGVQNIMRKLGMIDGSIEPQQGLLILDGRLTRTEVTANKGGLVRPFKDVGAAIKKGEVIGQIVNIYGDPVEDVVSPVDGWILAWPWLGNQAVGTGDILVFFVFRKPGTS